MKHLKKSPAMIFMYGTAAALLIASAALLFMNQDQCPLNYTQEQVDSSGCIVGANIGLGLAFMLAIGVWIAAIVIAAGIAISRKSKKDS